MQLSSKSRNESDHHSWTVDEPGLCIGEQARQEDKEVNKEVSKYNC